jgi:hypothetical protein
MPSFLDDIVELVPVVLTSSIGDKWRFAIVHSHVTYYVTAATAAGRIKLAIDVAQQAKLHYSSCSMLELCLQAAVVSHFPYSLSYCGPVLGAIIGATTCFWLAVS